MANQLRVFHWQRHLRYLMALPLVAFGLSFGGVIQAVTPAAAARTSAGLTSAAAKCTGKPITLLTVGDSTPSASPFYQPGVQNAAAAAQHAINKTCEDGRKVTDIFCNNSGGTAGDVTCAQEAVADKVLAVAGGDAYNNDDINNIIAPAGIPYIGQDAIAATDTSSTLSFPLGSIKADLLGYAAAAHALGVTNV